MGKSIEDMVKGVYSCSCSGNYSSHTHHSTYSHMAVNYSGDYKSGRKRTCC